MFLHRKHRGCEIGYWLTESATGKGLMRRAVSALIDDAIVRFGTHRFEIGTATENRASCRVAESLGFTYEGTLRDNYSIKGKFFDIAIYSLLANEWRE